MAQRRGPFWTKKHSKPPSEPAPIEKTVDGETSVVGWKPNYSDKVIRIPERTYEKARRIQRREVARRSMGSCADEPPTRIALGRIFARAIDEYDRNHPEQGDPK